MHVASNLKSLHCGRDNTLLCRFVVPEKAMPWITSQLHSICSNFCEDIHYTFDIQNDGNRPFEICVPTKFRSLAIFLLKIEGRDSTCSTLNMLNAQTLNVS